MYEAKVAMKYGYYANKDVWEANRLTAYITAQENTNHSDYTRNSNINGFIEDGMENDAKEVFAGYKYDKNASDQSIRNTIDKVFYINQFIENNECEIKVKLSKSGIICLNEEVVPMYFLPERAIENFQIGSSISETEDVSTLEEWLKNSINDIKRTTDANNRGMGSQVGWKY